MANENINTDNIVKYNDLTDEQVVDIKKRIELFVESEEYWDKFAHHSIVPKGHKTFTSRRLIKPRVRPEDIHARAELVAPRSSKMAVATFTKTVENYGDRAEYTKEDIQYHFDDTVNNLAMTLKEIAVQKLDLIKGKAFISSRARLTYTAWDASNIRAGGIRALLKKATIILRKNHVKRYKDGKWLVHMTAEELDQFRTELEYFKEVISEQTKVKLEEGLESIGSWGDFTFSITESPIMYKDASVQYIVIQGRREIDGESPVDVAKLEGESGIDIFNDGLGKGVIEDEDGRIVADTNRQKGTLAINMDGLGAAVSDDLSILVSEVTLSEVDAYLVDPVSGITGYVSSSPVPSVTVVAIDGSTSYSDATLSYKDASGATVAAEKLVVGNKYTVTATKSSKSGSLTFIANPTNYFEIEIA